MKSATFQIIRPASLEFVLRYGGVPKGEMVRQIEAAGRQVSGYAKYTITRFDHEVGEKDVHITAPPLSDWFDEDPTIGAIYAKAGALGLEELHPSAGLHLAEFYTEQPEEEWILIGHKPIPVPAHGRYPRVLSVSRAGNYRYLNGYSAHPVARWPLSRRVAFGVPVSRSS